MIIAVTDTDPYFEMDNTLSVAQAGSVSLFGADSFISHAGLGLRLRPDL
ncbi:hypothetical protein GTF85_17910 [Roseobacter sp. HKCCD7924]|nr:MULTISPECIES: hypothetical protein [unclassified Roseobacter]NNV87239.1 hypothetical protein [Roseobacter sp. HKCCD8414]NNX23533.1 hypothetical protein [Roseobacter sp. HKCCD8626]NNY12894.1 hypothetical protein [Roseobacter sp. HKCCD8413]NNZ45001.1 hypothetical protein [Roseobacter sp. HKCCD9051]NNZ70535.1 hypothetical protein [Roseobacter sp. HKCCD6544]NOA93932.1 hypothetical protein [Roseobacter sp. HKCCD7561]NOD07352.1 hypothetical protein [Roseobacter sp. HKCCD8503]NPT99871.1 hypothe